LRWVNAPEGAASKSCMSGPEEECVMDDADVDRIAARVVEMMMEPRHLQALSSAIAKELRLLAAHYSAETAKLGQRLDASHY
jgi:hypothetical protein